MDSVGVNVKGLKELSKAFRQVDHDLPKELKDHLKDVADHVRGVIVQRMPFGSGEAAAGVRSRATQKGAGIAFPGGGTPWKGVKADYFPWLDFGGSTGRGHSIKRPVIAGGRYVYPGIAASSAYIRDEVDAAIEVVAKKAGFVTEGHL